MSFSDLLNALPEQTPDSGESGTTPATSPDPFDNVIKSLSSTATIKNPGADPAVSNELTALPYEVGRGATFNLIDKAVDPPPEVKEYEAEHPYGAAALRFAGSMIPGAMVPAAIPLKGFQAAPTLSQALRANIALGAGVGAASGYGESADHPVRDTAFGAGAGALSGGAGPLASAWLVRPAFEGLASRLSSGATDAMAFNRVRQRILQAQQFGGPTFDEMKAALQAQQDKPLGLVDVGPESLKGLAGSVARAPGAPNEVASAFFNNRDVTAMGRVLDDVDTHVSAGQDVFTALQAIDARKAQESKPLYDLFRGFRPMSPDEIQPGGTLHELMQTPAMKQAAQNALTIAANRRIDPNSLGLAFNEAGDPVFEKVPSWGTLQYIKQGLDDVIGANRNPVTGKINWDNNTRAVNTVLHDFQDFIEQQNPFWEPANQVWAGHTATQNAMEWGQDFKQFTPAQIQQRLAGMNPAEREAALVGLADTLRKDVMKTRASADEAGRLLPQGDQDQGWQHQQIAPFFQDKGTFNRWVSRVLAESGMAKTRNAVMSGSQTAARAREDLEDHGGMGAHVVQLGTGLVAMHHEPFAGIGMAYRGARGLLDRLREPNQRIAEQMAPILFNSDYATNVQNLERLGIAGSTPWLPRVMPGIAETAGAFPGGILGDRYGQKP